MKYNKILLSLFLGIFLFSLVSASWYINPSGTINGGLACTSSFQCKWGSCDSVYHLCADSPTGQSLGQPCVYNYQCTSTKCSNANGDFYAQTFPNVGSCVSNDALNRANYVSCDSGSQCQSGLCLSYISSSFKACMPSNVGSGGLCASGSNLQCISGYTCYQGFCRIQGVDPSTSPLPINLADTKSCTFDFQCLSNYCDSSKHCSPSQVGGVIPNGGSCSVNSNCQSNYCVDSQRNYGGTGGKICQDSNAPDHIGDIGSKCGFTFEGIKQVCRSNLECKNNLCQVPNTRVCSGIDPSCIVSGVTEKVTKSFGDTLTGVLSSMFGTSVSGSVAWIILILLVVLFTKFVYPRW